MSDPTESLLKQFYLRTDAFLAFVEGEHGVKLSAEDMDDHNVSEFFEIMAAVRDHLALNTDRAGDATDEQQRFKKESG